MKYNYKPEINPLIIFKNMGIENKKISQPVPNQKYLSKRREIIKIMIPTSQKMEFCSQTLFNAILYLDIIFYNERTSSVQKLNEFVLYGLCCLIISSKYNENDPNVPELKKFISSLSTVTRFRYRFSVSEIAKGEVFCLQHLDYKLNYYSIYQYISFFFVHGILLFDYGGKENQINENVSNKFLEQAYYVSRQILNYIIEEDFLLIGENCVFISVIIFRKSIEFLLGKNMDDVFKEVYHIDDQYEKYKEVYNYISPIADRIFKSFPINKSQNKKIREELLRSKIYNNKDNKMLIKTIKESLMKDKFKALKKNFSFGYLKEKMDINKKEDIFNKKRSHSYCKNNTNNKRKVDKLLTFKG